MKIFLCFLADYCTFKKKNNSNHLQRRKKKLKFVFQLLTEMCHLVTEVKISSIFGGGLMMRFNLEMMT